MSKDKYRCNTLECKLKDQIMEYEFNWGEKRPVCKECNHPPILLSNTDMKYLGIYTYGCSGGSLPFTH